LLLSVFLALYLTPYPTLPTLFDRGIVLYDLSVIMEYLDERFPFPPLLPVDPIEKSEKRLLIFRFTRAASSWFELANTIETGAKKDADNARKTLKSNLIELVPLFALHPFMVSTNQIRCNRCHKSIFKRYIPFRNQIVLNISSNATTSLVINNEAISFKARFDGKSQDIYVPTDAVLTIQSTKICGVSPLSSIHSW
jgi:hypothetical protein